MVSTWCQIKGVVRQLGGVMVSTWCQIKGVVRQLGGVGLVRGVRLVRGDR